MERLLAPALGLWMLCACAASPLPAPTPVQIPIDVTGITMTLLRIQPVIVMTGARAFTSAQRKAMETDLNAAANALGHISADQGAVRAVVLPLDRVMNTLDAVSFEPRLSRWLPVLDAVDAVLTEADAFAGVVSVRGRRVPPMTAKQGRQALGIRQ